MLSTYQFGSLFPSSTIDICNHYYSVTLHSLLSGHTSRLPAELLYGWGRQVAEDIYVDHINKKTTYSDPRLAFAIEEKDTMDITQKFNGSSTALQVLHGIDLSGKVAIVTGGNDGIGVETCRALAFHGAHVIMASRDMEKSKSVIDRIVNERSTCKLTALHLDLSSFASVRKFVKEFESLNLPLHMLILNAGVFGAGHKITEDGIEGTFQVNHLSNFLLVKLLEKRLVTSAPARVIVLSSENHRFSFLSQNNISQEYLSPSTSCRFIPMIAYNDTKLCNILFASQLNKRLSQHKVLASSLHPGALINTNLSRNWWFYRLLFTLVRPFTKSVEQGAATTIYAATSPDLEGIGGLYFDNCGRCTPSRPAQDEELAEKLWTLSESLINLSSQQLESLD